MKRPFTALAAGMILLGAVGTFGGLSGLRLWDGAGPALRAFYVLSLLAGPAMLVCGIWLFRARSRNTAAAWTGSAAAALLGTALLAGVCTGAIPCSSPGGRNRNLALGGGFVVLGLAAGVGARRNP